MKIGIIGCGNISKTYLENARRFPSLEIIAVADIRPEAAQVRAQEFGLVALSVEELLAHQEIGAVVNLTIPAAHVEVSRRALAAGKHVYVEKPIGIDLASAKDLLDRADALGLRVGCAPDTFLGAGQQTARHCLDHGMIGKALSGTIFMLGAGPESWHPNPQFFYEPGGGPMLDMGPYYITALVNLFGPVKSVIASTTRGYTERICGHESIRGQKIPVQVYTHYTGVLEFHSGPVITAAISFDVKSHGHRNIEIYGTEGSLSIPDPNTFGGEVLACLPGSKEWVPQPYTHEYADNSRILGLIDLLDGLQQRRASRCDGRLAYHVLEVMLSFEKSHESGRRVYLESQPERPAALPEKHLFV